MLFLVVGNEYGEELYSFTTVCTRVIIRLCHVILLNASGTLFVRGAMETIRELLSAVYHLAPLSPPAVSGRNKGMLY